MKDEYLNPKMAYVIDEDGKAYNVEPNDGKEFSLEELRGYVKGHIEKLDLLKTGEIMWLNEEGKLDGMRVNPTATVIAHITGSGIAPNDVIVGPVLICRNDQVS